MHRSPPAGFRVKASATALTLLVHGIFSLLLLAEASIPPRPLPPPRQVEGMWIHFPGPLVAGPVASAPAPVPDQDQQPAPPIRPPTAITLAPPLAEPASPAGPTAPAAPAAARDAEHWRAESARAAARAAEEGETERTFGPPVQAMREPCKPRESSFEWKDKPPRDEPEINPLLPPKDSVMLGGQRVGVVGIGIRLGGPKPEPNKHLFDDMQEGKTPHSSVPHPHYCD